jgi:hypothetical protein
MSILLLSLALVAPVEPTSQHVDPADAVTCSVQVATFNRHGGERPARMVTGNAPAVIFQGRLSRSGEDTPPLLFDVFNPRGQRYQVLVAQDRVSENKRLRRPRKHHTRQATLAVAGSSIVWASMYGRWRVEPRIEGQDKPCGRAEYFTIRP